MGTLHKTCAIAPRAAGGSSHKADYFCNVTFVHGLCSCTDTM